MVYKKLRKKRTRDTLPCVVVFDDLPVGLPRDAGAEFAAAPVDGDAAADSDAVHRRGRSGPAVLLVRRSAPGLKNNFYR